MTLKASNKGLAALGSIVLLAGCVSSPPQPRPGPVTGPMPTLRPPPPGDALLGRNAAALIALLGTPALDVREGPARKLQFSGAACVLDAYLYPREGRGEPIALHVDTRLPDGRDTDRDSCLAHLRRR
jgi:hypothetical protein